MARSPMSPSRTAAVALLLAMAILPVVRASSGTNAGPGSARVDVRFGGSPGRITAIRTGNVEIKRCHRDGCLPEATPYPLRFVAILLDWEWADPMPVWAYLVEHPEGAWLIDAGANPRFRDPDAWSFDPVRRRIIQSFIGLDVEAPETTPVRLRSLGVDPGTVRGVVLTHQHVDHTGSVPEFPNADIWTSTEEDSAADSIGAMHPLWRGEGTRVRYVDREGTPPTPGAAPSLFLTSDRRIEVVSTPGHTPGSLSVRIAIDGGDVWMIGDTAFTASATDPHSPTAGIHSDMAAVRIQQRRLRDAVPPGRIFPSHDPDVAQRLAALGGTP